MYESFRKSTAMAVLLIVLGILLVIYRLFAALAFSVEGLIAFMGGIGLLYSIQAAKYELSILRVENVELRKQLEGKAWR